MVVDFSKMLGVKVAKQLFIVWSLVLSDSERTDSLVLSGQPERTVFGLMVAVTLALITRLVVAAQLGFV